MPALEDLVIGSSPLSPGEVRVGVQAVAGSPEQWVLSVAAPDRRGLLATTAAVATAQGLSVRSAAARRASHADAAVQRLELVDLLDRPNGEPDWTVFASTLRAALVGESGPPAVAYQPVGRATVTIEAYEEVRSPEGEGWQVGVRAPDGTGLLATIASWLADHGADIVEATVGSTGSEAVDVFHVRGPADLPHLVDDLARRLSR